MLLSDVHHLEIQLFHMHRLGEVEYAYSVTMHHLVSQARCQESLGVFGGPVHSNICIIQKASSEQILSTIPVARV